MTKHRLVVVDLDGTLIDGSGVISVENRRAIRAVQKQGIALTLATGRTFMTTEPFIKQLNIKLPVICYHGSLIRTKKKIFFSRRLPEPHLRQLIKFGFRHRVQVAIFSKEQAFFNKPIDYWGREYINHIEPVNEINLVDLINYDFPERPHKVMFVASERKIRQLEKLARREFGHSFYVTRSRSNLLEFLHPHKRL